MKNAIENNVLTIQTIQIAPIRQLMSSLKEILVETNITFKADGIRIINMDKSHTMVVHMFLAAEKFDFYECKKEKIIIGVNVSHLQKLINTIENNDTLTLYIENCDYTDGIVKFLTLKYENGNIKQCKTQKLLLIEPELEELEFPNVYYSSIINMPSVDFQKIIRDLSAISDFLEIKSVGNELIFKCQGNFASAEIHRTESDGSNNEDGNKVMQFVLKQDLSKVIQGKFSLKNLGYFITCTNLCSQIELYLENNLPLVVKYDVADLGEIKLCLALHDECSNNL